MKKEISREVFDEVPGSDDFKRALEYLLIEMGYLVRKPQTWQEPQTGEIWKHQLEGQSWLLMCVGSGRDGVSLTCGTLMYNVDWEQSSFLAKDLESFIKDGGNL